MQTYPNSLHPTHPTPPTPLPLQHHAYIRHPTPRHPPASHFTRPDALAPPCKHTPIYPTAPTPPHPTPAPLPHHAEIPHPTPPYPDAFAVTCRHTDPPHLTPPHPTPPHLTPVTAFQTSAAECTYNHAPPPHKVVPLQAHLQPASGVSALLGDGHVGGRPDHHSQGFVRRHPAHQEPGFCPQGQVQQAAHAGPATGQPR